MLAYIKTVQRETMFCNLYNMHEDGCCVVTAQNNKTSKAWRKKWQLKQHK